MPSCLLIKNANLYDPEPQGLRDIFMVNEKIIAIGEDLSAMAAALNAQVLDAAGRTVVPGYVDQHVHALGGGGEAGPYSRTPEVMLSGAVSAGVTTLIGVLGTDGTTRHPESLLAKVQGLDFEGITAYMLTGSYELPLKNMTGDARNDIILIERVLGIGEVAISDHRSSQPTKDELKRLLTQARLGGMLSGKAGAVQFHLGTGKTGLKMLFEIIDETEIPARHMVPTHVNRDPGLFEQAKELARKGGYMDITSGIRADDGFEGGIAPHDALLNCWEEGVPMSNVTMSSDGNGGMTVFLPDGRKKLLAAKLSSLHEELTRAVKKGLPLEIGLRVVGENPARANGLWPNKGCLKVDSDADLLIWDADMNIDTVVAKGRILQQDKQPVVLGTFEDADL